MNKVKFGLKNAHYAVATINTESNEVSFGAVKPLPGSVSLAMDAEGEESTFFADDRLYYTSYSNSGYSGDLELALVPDSFREDVLKEKLDNNKVMVENADVEPAHFALLFEFSGDAKKIRHCLYYCTASRPSLEGKTIEKGKEVQTEKLSITASPLPSGIVKSKTGPTTTEDTYKNWYNQVYVPVNE